MSPHALFLSWTRPRPGRERLSAQHFHLFEAYLAGLARDRRISSFEMVVLDGRLRHFTGFFLVQGDRGALRALIESPEWLEHMERASAHLDGIGPTWALTDELMLRQVAVPAPLGLGDDSFAAVAGG